jgi:hypothetical protein
MAEITDLDVTDANNTGRWPDGMNGRDINNSGRAMEGYLARWFQDWNGSVVASGSSNAYAITSNRTIASLVNNTVMWWRANHTNTGAATLALNGLTAKDIVRATGAALTAGDITSGQIVGVYYNSTLDDWVLITPAVQGTASESATGLIELATAAEVEALDSSRAVRASTMHRHPGMAKAGGNLNGTGTPAFAAGDYGMGAVTDNGVGNYTVQFDTAFANTNYWLAGFARNDTDVTADQILSAEASGSKTTSAITLETGNVAATADSPEMGMSFWGDYA